MSGRQATVLKTSSNTTIPEAWITDPATESWLSEHPMIIVIVAVKNCLSLPFIIGESLLIILTQGLNLPPFKPITGFFDKDLQKSPTETGSSHW